MVNHPKFFGWESFGMVRFDLWIPSSWSLTLFHNTICRAQRFCRFLLSASEYLSNMLFSYHLLYFCTALSLIIMLSSHYHHHWESFGMVRFDLWIPSSWSLTLFHNTICRAQRFCPFLLSASEYLSNMLFSYHLLYFCTALSLIIMLSSHYHHHKSKTFSQLTQCPFTGTLLL